MGGDEKFNNNFFNQAKELSLENNIVFTSWLDHEHIKLAYYVSDLIIVPSICFDSFPTVNLEAMVCKRPVIASCFGGSKELVVHNKTGFIINPFVIEKNVEYVVRLLKNNGLSKEMGNEGFERVVNGFNIKKQVEEYYC